MVLLVYGHVVICGFDCEHWLVGVLLAGFIKEKEKSLDSTRASLSSLFHCAHKL